MPRDAHLSRLGGVLLTCLVVATPAYGQATPSDWEPITQERLAHPEAGDWMNYRRTYDVQGFSPLDQINRGNVDQLRLVWS